MKEHQVKNQVQAVKKHQAINQVKKIRTDGIKINKGKMIRHPLLI